MRKSEVQMHTNNGYGAYYPAINVKVRSFPSVEQVMAEWPECDEATAGKALEFALESTCGSFWEYWQDTTGDVENGLHGSAEYAYFPKHKVMIYSAGRSGGWLIVQGLPELESWDAVMLARWAKFRKSVLEDVAYRTSWEAIKEDIEANDWYKPHSSRFNFYRTPDGRDINLADARADVLGYAEQKYDGAAAAILRG